MTALHLAVIGQEAEAVKQILEVLKQEPDILYDVLHLKAEG